MRGFAGWGRGALDARDPLASDRLDQRLTGRELEAGEDGAA